MAEKAEKLQAFVWEGKDRKGNKTKGEVSGTNLALVKAQLRKQGIIPDKVKKKTKAPVWRQQKDHAFRHRHAYPPARHHDEGWRATGSEFRYCG